MSKTVLTRKQQKELYMDWLLYYASNNLHETVKVDKVEVINSRYEESDFNIAVTVEKFSFYLYREPLGQGFTTGNVEYLFKDETPIFGHPKILYLFKDSINPMEHSEAMDRKYGTSRILTPNFGKCFKPIHELFDANVRLKNTYEYRAESESLVNFDVVTNPHSGMLF